MTTTSFYHNGQYLNNENTSISAADRGFRFGDGVFETIAVYSGRPYQLEWHLERLNDGLAAIKIPQTSNLKPQTLELISRNKIVDGFARIMVSRGEGSQGYLPKPDTKPTVIVETYVRTQPIPESATLFFSSYLKPSLKSLPVNFKLAQGLNSSLARIEAQEKGCFEALQMNSEGYLCEASSANLFWVKGEQIFTPALSTGCLKGSTRAALMRLTKIEEVSALVADLKTADEVFLTNTNWQILPVTELKPMGWKWPVGKIAAQLHEQLKHDIASYVQNPTSVA